MAIEWHASSCGTSEEETKLKGVDIIPGTCQVEETEVESSPEPTVDLTVLDSTDSVPCPICSRKFPVSRINFHANICAELSFQLPTHLSSD